MLSNNRIAVGFTLLLAGCVSGGGYGDAPRIAEAPTGAREEAYLPPQDEPSASAGDLQAEYAPEPGAPSYEEARTERLPPSRVAPGAGYDRPGSAPRPTSADRDPLLADRAPPRAYPADVPPEVAAGSGPRGTSGEQQRYDQVGYASWYGAEMGDARTADGRPFVPGAIGAAHRTLPLGSIVEVTALDTGRTILVLVNDRGPGARDREIDLSRGAAQALGLTAAMAPVRVRLVTASPQDVNALRSGGAAAQRIDAPPSLLAALRRKLPARNAALVARPRPDRVPPAIRSVPRRIDAVEPAARQPAPARQTTGIFVQVAALSNEARAQALATSLGGRVARAGSIYRVQIGPYANTASAQRARDDAARRGYGDARIVTTN